MSEGDYGEVFEQQLVLVLSDGKVHRLPQPRINAGKWWSQTKLEMHLKCRRSSSHFLPTVRIYLKSSRVLKVEIFAGEGEGWGREAKCQRCYAMQIFSFTEEQHANTGYFRHVAVSDE